MLWMGSPLPQLFNPYICHSSVPQIASHLFQNSGVMPEYTGFFKGLVILPFLISQPISMPNWKLSLKVSILQLLFVLRSIPSLVSEIRSSRLPSPDSMFILLIRISGMLFHELALTLPFAPCLLPPIDASEGRLAGADFLPKDFAVSLDVRKSANLPFFIISTLLAFIPSS